MFIIRRMKCIDAASDIVTLSKWPSGALVESEVHSQPVHVNLCIGRPVTESDDTRYCINTVHPPDDEHIMLETCGGL